jgi:hypothetical protein
MASLTFFTAKLWYPAVIADTAADPDYDPQVQGIMAGAMITAKILGQPPPKGDDMTPVEIPAEDLSPTAAMLILAPIDCRLNDGHLCLRAGPDLVVHSYPNAVAFPAIGSVDHLYFAADVDKVYKWVPTGPSSGGYLEVSSFSPVRLAADTDVLGLPEGAFLAYQIDFDHVRYGGGEHDLPSFAFKAPSTDIELDLATAERVPI